MFEMGGLYPSISGESGVFEQISQRSVHRGTFFSNLGQKVFGGFSGPGLDHGIFSKKSEVGVGH